MTAGDATGWGQHRMEAPDYMLDAALQASLRESLETSLAPASAESPLETDAEAEAEAEAGAGAGAGARVGVESEAEAAEEGRSVSTTPTSRASPEPAAVMPEGSMGSVAEDTPPPPPLPPPPHTSVTDVTVSVPVSDSAVGPALSAAVPPEAPAAPVEQHEWRVCGEGI